MRLLLSSGTERYEPTLAALQAMPVQMSRESEERSERILCEFEAIVRMVSEECDALISSIDALGGLTEYSGDLASAHAAAEEENTIVEYLIGCAMYYRSMTDEDLRFDLSYLRKAFGHFSAFLSSELVSGDSDTPFDLPSLIGFRDLRTLCENARRYRAALSDSVGIGSGEV